MSQEFNPAAIRGVLTGLVVAESVEGETAAKWVNDAFKTIEEIYTVKGVNILDAGFGPLLYPGDDGIFLGKILRAEQMPYMVEHVIDNEEIFDSTEVSIEIYPDRRIVMSLADHASGGYDEEYLDYIGEGWNLLKDALGK